MPAETSPEPNLKPGSDDYLHPEGVHTISHDAAHRRVDEIANERLRVLAVEPGTSQNDADRRVAEVERDRLLDHVAVYQSSVLGATWDELSVR